MTLWDTHGTVAGQSDIDIAVSALYKSFIQSLDGMRPRDKADSEPRIN